MKGINSGFFSWFNDGYIPNPFPLKAKDFWFQGTLCSRFFASSVLLRKICKVSLPSYHSYLFASYVLRLEFKNVSRRGALLFHQNSCTDIYLSTHNCKKVTPLRFRYRRPRISEIRSDLELVMDVLMSDFFIFLDLFWYSIIFTILLFPLFPSIVIAVLFFISSYVFFSILYILFFKKKEKSSKLSE